MFFFFYSPHKPPFSTLCQLSGDLLSPQVIQTLHPCLHLPVSCFASSLTILCYPINATYPESLFSSDDLCTKETKSADLANWLNTKRYKIICRISGPRAALGKEREVWPSQVASWLSWLDVTVSSLSRTGLEYECAWKTQSEENKDHKGATLCFSRILAADTKRAA